MFLIWQIHAHCVWLNWLSIARWLVGDKVTGRFAPGRIQSFLLIIQLKSKYHRFGCFNYRPYSCYSVRMSCWIKRLLTCLLTYLPGGETSRGELIKGRNVHKSVISTRVEDTVACRRSSRGSSTRLWRLVVSGQIQARHSPPTAQEGRSRQGAAQELQASFQSTILVQIAGEGDTKAAATFFECSQHDADTPVGIQALS